VSDIFYCTLTIVYRLPPACRQAGLPFSLFPFLKIPFLKHLRTIQTLLYLLQNLKSMQESLLFISGGEIVVVLLVFLLLFGAKKLPDFAKGLGKGLNEFKKATDDIKREINESTKEMTKEVNDIKSDIKKDINPS